MSEPTTEAGKRVLGWMRYGANGGLLPPVATLEPALMDVEREAVDAWLASEEAVRELTGAIHRNEDDDHIADVDDGRGDDCEDYARVILESIREGRRMASGEG